MGRLLLLLVAGAALLAARPDLRAGALPRLRWMLTPAYEWSARWKLGEITKALDAEAARGRPLPRSEALPDFVRGYFPGTDTHLDPWGTPFFLQRSRRHTRVASAGPDSTPHTPDDILSRPIRVSGR